ncbi:hypothetical protein JTE90_000752 [Oedothorax gibbosus]|uniref:BTB domain-containing protein n=1 Tax=Oedothorax gibbosus TaxID=931172 RepID=A0AAV6UQ74_9ARAC|nr:hypothetical protein JTE90_000752 [Oedothorax gibbosus]
MQENRSGTVDIVDIQEEVMQAMLKYIYGGKVDDQLLPGDLMSVADKYELKGLNQTCIDSLKNTLSMDNALHVLILGYLHDRKLKEYSIEFICKQNLFLELEGTEEWELMKKNHTRQEIEGILNRIHLQTKPVFRTRRNRGMGIDEEKSPSFSHGTSDVRC